MNLTNISSSSQNSVQTIHFYTAPTALSVEMTAAAWNVYHALSKMAPRGTPHVTAMIKEIAAAANVSARHTKRILQKLSAEGLISIDKNRRYVYTYYFIYLRPEDNLLPDNAVAQETASTLEDTQKGQASQTDKTGESPPGPCTNTNTLNFKDKIKQLSLIERKNDQALTTLGISAQHLTLLGIKTDICQRFPSAPALIRQHTPAEVLIGYDPTGRIAKKLAEWAAAYQKNPAAFAGLSPALMWAKIVENQDPPAPTKPKSISQTPTETLAEFDSAPQPAETSSELPPEPEPEPAPDSSPSTEPFAAPETPPPAMTTPTNSPAEALWAAILADIQHQLTKAQFHALSFVQPHHVTAEALIVSATGPATIILQRAEKILTRLLKEVTGRPLVVQVAPG